MKINLIAVLIGIIISCSTKQTSTSEVSPLPNNFHSVPKEALYKEKVSIDTLFSQKKKLLTVLVKTMNNNELIRVVNENWPSEIEITYNILIDSEGRVNRISEFPYSESGDWEIMYSHYFDKNGNTFAFERQIRAFNTVCPGEDDFDKLTIEKIIKLYSPEHAMVDSTYKMTDGQGMDITNKKCQQEVESDNQVFKNLLEYTRNKNIKTTTNKS
ncbi:MAG: hypothetical protein M3Q05_15615 [Bacteroidota bacterium]|nr:hypothetical protein [Bacteroidota bacterium]